jgi:hypothetical protein
MATDKLNTLENILKQHDPAVTSDIVRKAMEQEQAEADHAKIREIRTALSSMNQLIVNKVSHHRALKKALEESGKQIKALDAARASFVKTGDVKTFVELVNCYSIF